MRKTLSCSRGRSIWGESFFTLKLLLQRLCFAAFAGRRVLSSRSEVFCRQDKLDLVAHVSKARTILRNKSIVDTNMVWHNVGRTIEEQLIELTCNSCDYQSCRLIILQKISYIEIISLRRKKFYKLFLEITLRYMYYISRFDSWDFLFLFCIARNIFRWIAWLSAMAILEMQTPRNLKRTC